MPYAMRVRLYRGDALEADTDPDADPNAPGSERAVDVAGIQAVQVELCSAFHGAPVFDAEKRGRRPVLLGFEAIAMHGYGCMIRERAAGGGPFSFSQGYTVLEGHHAEMWRAQVDIQVSR